MAATNRPETLDNALKRPGRFDRHISLVLPDISARKEIFTLYLKKLKLSPVKGFIENLSKRLATLTPGFSGADIANVCNEAAIIGARGSLDHLIENDFTEACDRIIGGLKRKGLVEEREKRVVAYHEAGHALTSWFLEGADPLLKVTIIARSKGALGFA